MLDARSVLSLADAELARVDPVWLNLWVASGVPRLSGPDIPRYQRIVDGFAEEVGVWLRHFEPQFHEDPEAWQGDLNFFNLGVLYRYIEEELGVQYKEDQKGAASVRYTDPSDLFLNGVIDTRRGTCGNMAALHVAIGWRLGWPVSLAAARSHLLLRYDDGRARYNVEATRSGLGGMSTPPDEYYVRKYGLPPEAIRSGSDLRAVTPRELLGIFVGLRARHFRDVGEFARAEGDYALALQLFPVSRCISAEAAELAMLRAMVLFSPREPTSPFGHTWRGNEQSWRGV